jgi:YVTN family beta-propeller protein
MRLTLSTKVLLRLKGAGRSRSKQLLVWAIALISLAALSSRMLTTAQAPPPAYANFEGAQTNPVRLSTDGTHMFAVNTANASLSVFDVTTPASPRLLEEIPVGVEPVSVNPRTADEVWVVNEVSNSISVVSLSQKIVTATINVGLMKPPALPTPAFAEPMDVVFENGLAYVSISRANTILVLNATTHSFVEALPVFGGNPRALAVSPDGSKVYAAFAISGNGSTLVPTHDNCPQTPPVNSECVYPQPNYTNPKYASAPIPPVGVIVSAKNPPAGFGQFVTYQMPDNDVAIINTGSTPSVAGYYSAVGTINLGLAVNPVTGDLYVANTDALNTTEFEGPLCGHWVNNQITRITVASSEITPFDLNPGATYGCAPNTADLESALAQPAGVVFDPSGNFMYVAAFGTDRVAKVSTSGQVMSFVEVAPATGQGANIDPANKRGPRGLALLSGANTLYSLNRISNTISVINTESNAVTSEVPVGTDPTPPSIKQGRGFLYDAKLSGTGNGSCASCHVDGDMDHLAWNLGDPTGSFTKTNQNGQTINFSPLKGPMTTQTLRGLINMSPYHWRGDKPSFLFFDPAFAALMGGNQISQADMVSFLTFANSIMFLPNPYQNLDRTLPTALNGRPGPGLGTGGNPQNGQSDFLLVPGTEPAGSTCTSCHTAPPGPGSNRSIQAAAHTAASQPLKVPQLRNMYEKELFNRSAAQVIDGFGFNHDGQAGGLVAFLSDTGFRGYTQQQKDDIVAFMLCFDTGTAPAVGFTRTLTSVNVNNSTLQSNWSLLQSQAAAGNIDLIVRGTIQGQVHGLLYQPTSSNYLSDSGTTYTQTQLQTFITNGDTMSVMGVYPGTGTTHY